MTAPPERLASSAPRGTLLASGLAGALLGSLAVATLTALLPLLLRLAVPDPARAHAFAIAWREWLAGGGWFLFPCLSASAALLIAGARRPAGARPWGPVVIALLVALLPFLFKPIWRDRDETAPATQTAKMRAVLKWSYRTPATVLRVVGLSRDPDPRVREQAVMALGVNLVVTDIEHATAGRPARYLGTPVRDSLRARLLEALRDSSELVRAEAARALWKAPVALRGPHPEAAETLAAVLDRAALPGQPERLAWLALDAAAGEPDSALRAAAGRFAAWTPDSALGKAARRAADWPARSASVKREVR